MADQFMDHDERDNEPGADPAPGTVDGTVTSTDAEFTVDDVADTTLPVLVTQEYHVGVIGNVQRFSHEARKVLTAPVDPENVEVRPDGFIFLPGIFYQEILDKAFGQGAWTLVRLDDGLNPDDNMVYYRGALFVEGRFVTEAIGENEYYPAKRGMTRARSLESARTECLKRCCKHLGVSSDLWKPRWVRQWLKDYAIQVWCKNIGTRGDDAGKKRPLWRRKDAPPIDTYPWKEERDQQQGGRNDYAHKPGPYDAPDPYDAPAEPSQKPTQQSRPDPQQPPAKARQPEQQPPRQQQAARPASQGPPRPWAPIQLAAMFRQKVTQRVSQRPEFGQEATEDDMDNVLMHSLFPIFHAVELGDAFLTYVYPCGGNINKLKSREYNVDFRYTRAQLEVARQWAASQDANSTATEAQQFIQTAITIGIWGNKVAETVTEAIQQELGSNAGDTPNNAGADNELPF
jgi:hypothetical protein